MPDCWRAFLSLGATVTEGSTVVRHPSASPAALMALNPGIRLPPASGPLTLLLLSMVLGWRYRACCSGRRQARTLLGCVLCTPAQVLCSRNPTYSGSLQRKLNTKYRLGGNSHQADISRVRTKHGDSIAISDDGIKHMHTFH